MTNYLEYQIDKFIFRIADDRFYTDDGLWVMPETTTARIGISDYMQQRSGDVAFAEVKPEGTVLAVGDELAVIETIKVNISIVSPAAGKVIEVNPLMETSPEVINQDPYGTGWLAEIELGDQFNSLERLLDPHTYLSKIMKDAEQELDAK
jgi:glycine cleavage system H protein